MARATRDARLVLQENDWHFRNSTDSTSPVKPFMPPLPLDYYQAAHEDRRAAMLEQELGDIERRKAKLAELPTGKYAAGNRQRHVFMNLDNIAGAVCNSQWLYQLVAGASSGYDVRLNFRALTERVCGSKASLVKRRLASYRKMPRELALPLQEFDWEIHALSQSSSGNKGLYYELLDLLETAGAAKHKNTLVLVMGDGALGGSGVEQKEATKDLLTKFLDKNWFVEIHSWLHALNDWFLDIQEQYQYRVAVKPLDDAIHDLVYLKQDEEDVSSSRELTSAAISTSVCVGNDCYPDLVVVSYHPVTDDGAEVGAKMRLEDERKDLLGRLRKNQEALDALELGTWSMQQQELAQQASDKQLAIRMAEEEEMQLKLLQERGTMDLGLTSRCWSGPVHRAAADSSHGRHFQWEIFPAIGTLWCVLPVERPAHDEMPHAVILTRADTFRGTVRLVRFQSNGEHDEGKRNKTSTAWKTSLMPSPNSLRNSSTKASTSATTRS
ncbi:hypothetical protein GQ600_21802 [Phytophthora cactorum]|nr:hypothetical protein GQ600_21802 [Phytophthora cactorum]